MPSLITPLNSMTTTPTSDKKLFILDAMALIYRAHFAFSKNPRITSTGLNTGSIFGFTNSLWEVISKEKPTHITVAFDLPGPTFRHENFEAYKANRQEQPEDITIAIPIIKKMLKLFNITALEAPGYEADDLAGTVAKKAEKEGFITYLMTMDKDYSQLVSEQTFLFKPAYLGAGYEVYDIPRVLERFGIERVEQVIDILGLMGDAVDNIPGIPGIGEKTAQKLIAEYGSVENLIANTDKLKGKMQENVRNFAQQGLLSKELATIYCDVPVEINLDSFAYQGPDVEKLSAFFDELEFRQIKKRVLGLEDEAPATQKAVSKNAKTQASAEAQMSLFGPPPELSESASSSEEDPLIPTRNYQTIDTTLHHYYTMESAEQRAQLIAYLERLPEFCFDTETTALEATDADLVGLSFSWHAGEAYYVPVPADSAEAKKIVTEFKSVFENKNIGKVGQNIKYDLLILKNYDIELQGTLFDTMLAHYLLDPETRHNMDVLAENFLQYSPVSIEELIGKKGSKQKNMRDVPLEKIAAYAAEDADITWQLKTLFEKELQVLGLSPLLNTVECPLVPVLADMEHEGVRIDTAALQEFSSLLGKEVETSEKKIYELAGVSFNIGSPKQLGDILFEKLKLDPKAKKTKTGQYATGEEVLLRLEEKHPIIKEILDFRELQKLKSTYVDALPQLISQKDRRVHTSFNQAVAATGRLSSTNPNLQNIPIRTERGKEIRKAFVPRDEHHLILSADYSQIELRIMAEFSKEKNMTQSFRDGIDIHSTTASKVFQVPLEEVNSDMRRKAKMVNFGIIYGISAFGLSQRLDIPKKEASAIIESYFEQFPDIKKYMDSAINKAREVGYVETILGRRRYLPDITSGNFTNRGFAERNAINAPIQGSAADMIKMAMIKIHAWMKQEKLKSRMILQVHDELLFDVVPEELELMKAQIPHFMKTAIPMEVPMEVGVGVGKNWLEAH
ncbi:MAG: DNA polymerase I [Cytophagaceae bacterium]|nr:DNA polymerase I [Cytophagaceae bacterium]